jgi:7,8-dihydropterin-6-yl-methyl-4-(beta-D-ribofuranosyl)aminobenzene 5'-phosphate synthase
VYVRAGAAGAYYAQGPEGAAYIGLDPRLEAYRDRFTVVEGVYRIDEELTLFDAAGTFPAMDTSARLKMRTDAGDLVPDTFTHEQDLLLTAEGKTVVVAGCAHRGIVNIQRRAAELLGRQPDTVVGGFHLFQLDPADPASDRLLEQIGQALLPGDTVYYTGHCTGDYPFRVLRGVLGDRLRAISGGSAWEL